jgi:hypothetical protein
MTATEYTRAHHHNIRVSPQHKSFFPNNSIAMPLEHITASLHSVPHLTLPAGIRSTLDSQIVDPWSLVRESWLNGTFSCAEICGTVRWCTGVWFATNDRSRVVALR